MRIININTSKGQELKARYNNYEGVSLRDVYGSYSVNKERAFKNCIVMYLNTERATDFHICSHNCNYFTVAWSVLDEVGDVEFLVVRTYANVYKVVVK